MSAETAKAVADEKLERIRHSASHVLADAVLTLFPGTRLGIGPAIENGFYYDFEPPRPFTPDDLTAIEDKMRDLVRQGLTFGREAISRDGARQLFRDQPYKLELIDNLTDGDITIYRSGGFVDLCAGPHVATTKEIRADAFKLDKIAGAYWRGSEKNPMLQRIYGLAFGSRQELEAYIAFQEEIK
jgi:threonyl-tRNA synthetase